MAKQNKVEDEAASPPAFDKPKPDYEQDTNVQARKRAAKRSGNRNAGKPVDDGVFGEPEAPKVEDEGGIVAEAEEELAEAKTEGEEAPAEAPKAEGEETPAEETPAEETPAEETPAEETPAEETPAEETPAEETAEPVSEQTPEEEQGEYTAPEGESHDDLINRYHEAIAYGDVQHANELYKQLQDHRYQENRFRSKKDAIDEAEAREHLAAAKELAAKFPELNEDGVAADKVLALAEVYRGTGLKPAAALRQACADLYHEQPTGTDSPEVPPAEPAAAEEVSPSPAEATPAAEEEPAASVDAEASEPMADMAERAVKKRAIAEIPAASARNEETPPPPKPTRSSAITDMKRARGQM